MRSISYYKMVEAENAEDLQKMVNNCIESGFEPLGGVSVCVLYSTWENPRKGYEESEITYTYAQAVVDHHP